MVCLMQVVPRDCEGKKSRIGGNGWDWSGAAQLTALTRALGAQRVILKKRRYPEEKALRTMLNKLVIKVRNMMSYLCVEKIFIVIIWWGVWDGRNCALNKGTIHHKTSIVFSYMQCCGSESGIWCLFDPWIRDMGWVKNQDPDSAWTSRIIFSESWETIFWVKIT